MNKFVNSPLLHPFLFAVFPVLFLYAGNLNMVTPYQLRTPILLSLAFTAICFLVCLPIFRTTRKAALFVSAFIIVFFQYSALTDLIENIGNSILPTHRYLILSIVAGLLLLAWFIYRIRKPLIKTTLVINAIAIFTVLPSAFRIAYETIANQTKVEETESRKLTLPAGAPDIYYFILDGYPRQDVLKSVYGYDNGPFLNELRKRGFYVAPKSTSNYYWTKLSITSSLNFNYLTGVAAYAKARNKQNFPLRKLVQHSAIKNTLEAYGYRYISFASGFEITEIKNADQYWSHPLVFNEFNTALFSTTILPNIFQRFFSEAFYSAHRQTTLYPFQNLPEITRQNIPKFVQIHLLSPHPPFVFGPQGEPVQPLRTFSLADGKAFLRTGTETEYITGLTGQLTFLNKQLLTAVDIIQKTSERPAVILLQGDHGARLHTHGEDMDETEMLETFANLSAFYFPNKNYQALYPEITPVNSFRVVLNLYFDKSLSLLPDRNLYCPLSNLANVTDVTPEVKSDTLRSANLNAVTPEDNATYSE